MATEDTQSTFDNVDWDSETSSTALISKTGIIEIFAFIGLFGAYLYDYYIIKNEYPTIGQWDVTSVEWMFIGVLILMVFNGILPLYRNQRMTKYYWRQFKKNKAAVVSLGFLIIIFTTGIIGPMILGPPQLRFGAQYMPPVGFTASPQGETVTGTWAHPLGTNAAGEDLLKLIIFGMRVSMEVGLISMVIATTIGTLVGTTAAFATSQNWGMIDEALMRYVDLQSVFPVFILLLLLVYLFGGQLYM
ncbi:MAG: ABC transporter permease, partial [Halobacteriaceae archaeon]